MRKLHSSLTLIPMLLLWLSACTSAPPPTAIVGDGAPRSTKLADDRKAILHTQLAPLCPQPLSPTALDRAANYLGAHPDSVEVIADLDRLDRGARVCRGIK